jgi:hypothetical protein
MKITNRDKLEMGIIKEVLYFNKEDIEYVRFFDSTCFDEGVRFITIKLKNGVEMETKNEAMICELKKIAEDMFNK